MHHFAVWQRRNGKGFPALQTSRIAVFESAMKFEFVWMQMSRVYYWQECLKCCKSAVLERPWILYEPPLILHCYWVTEVPLQSKCVSLFVPTLECSSFTVQDDACAESDTTRLRSRSLMKVQMSLCADWKSVFKSWAYELACWHHK